MQTEVPAINKWNLGTKLIFRFFALYFVTYIGPNLIYFNWDPYIHFLADKVLHIGYAITTKPNGSGDTTYYYVHVFGILILAISGTIIWSIIDHRRKNYDQLLYWIMVMVRYTLAMAMIGYGFAKIYKTQFPSSTPYALYQPFGESSPMGLVWKYMGYSTGYNYFTGIAEALGGVFLFFRRTSTFGALLSLSVLANIVALNFFFDVPVKLYSSHLLLMAVFVAAPDLQRLYNFFFLNKPVPAAILPPAFNTKWKQHTRVGLKVVVIGVFLYTKTVEGYFLQKRYGDKAPKPTLYGAYQVESFILNGDTLPPLTTDTNRWNRLMVNSKGFVTTQLMNDTMQHHFAVMDSTLRTFRWTEPKDSTKVTILHYSKPDSLHLALQGHINKDSVQIQLRKLDLKKFRLLSRGFHWINEYPYNR